MTPEQVKKGNELLEKIEGIQHQINQLEVIEKDHSDYRPAIVKKRDARDVGYLGPAFTMLFPIKDMVRHTILHLKAKKRGLEVELENIK